LQLSFRIIIDQQVSLRHNYSKKGGKAMQLEINQQNRDQIYEALNAMPCSVVIIRNSAILYANYAANHLRGNIEGELLESILGSSADYAKKRIHMILYEGVKSEPTIYTLKSPTGEDVFIEATAHPIIYDGDITIMVVAHNISDRINDIYSTSIEQQKQFHVGPTDTRNLLITTSYKASNYIGGDFFFLHPLSDDELIGVVGDVSGKGTLAAMAISSFEVLFHEASNLFTDIESLAYAINDKVSKYYTTHYVATIFFHITTKDVLICSCGINHFMTVSVNNELRHHSAKGPFLGMLPKSNNPLFDIVRFSRHDIRRLLLYSDGYETLLNDPLYNHIDLVHSTSTQINSTILNDLNQYIQANSRLFDDVVFMCIDFDFAGEVIQDVLYGLAHMKTLIHRITSESDDNLDTFNIKLILSELITNAYKYGNKENPLLPIGVKVIKNQSTIVVKVTDMAISQKSLLITSELNEDALLNDSGRGIFILSNICDKIYYDSNNIIAEYTMQH